MKKVTKKINDFITYIMFIIENCVTLIGEDKILLGFLVAGIIPNVMIKIHSDMAWFNIRSIIFNFTWFSLVVAFGYLFKKNRNRVIYYITVTTIMYILNYSNIMYYSYYESFLSLSLIKQLTLFKDVADATTVGITFFDFIYWMLLVLSLGLILYFAKTKDYNYDNKGKEIRKVNRMNFFKMALVSFVAGILTLAPGNYSQAEKLWNRPIVVENFGLYNYHLIDVVKSAGVFITHEPSKSDYQEFIDYFNNKSEYERTNNQVVNEYTNKFKGKNVIVIHAESLEGFVMNKEINGVEITPNLNRIASEGLYFSNFYTQQSIGTSADSEFVFNTSLLPVNNGTVFLTHFDRTYNSTQKLLRDNGYYTVYMHGNKADFWNRRIMRPVLGYDTFYSENEYHKTEENTIGLGISDVAFFDQSLDYLMNTPKPYYATLITLTNHTPWKEVNKYDDNVDTVLECPEDIEDLVLCNYLKAVHYMDYAIGKFFNDLEKRNALDDTIFVIYGDHPASIPQRDMEELYGDEMSKIEYNASKKVPFIIWSDDFVEGKEIETVMGQIDVGPTLQNMLGVPKNQFALGQDIFSITENIVPFVNGNWTDGTVFYDSFKDEYFIQDPDMNEDMITDEYIDAQTKAANKIIDMSNQINYYDLIAHYEEKNNITHKPIS